MAHIRSKYSFVIFNQDWSSLWYGCLTGSPIVSMTCLTPCRAVVVGISLQVMSLYSYLTLVALSTSRFTSIMALFNTLA